MVDRELSHIQYYSSSNDQRTEQRLMNKLTTDEIVEYSNVILNWTPSIGDATVDQVSAASKLHAYINQNFIRLYGDQLKELHQHNYTQLKDFNYDN